MTRWQEVDDLQLDQEFDEFDPMAAPTHSGMDTDDQEPDDLDPRGESADEDELFSTGPWTAEAGFTDPSSSVRVWVDEEQIISKVRISPSWRERVGSGGLEQAFGLCFLQINNYFREPSPATSMEGDDRFAKMPLRSSDMVAIIRRNDEIRSHLKTLGPEAQGNWKGSPSVGVTPDKSVALTLDLHGKLARIEFNSAWLEQARVRQISNAVVRAHREARALFVPPTYEEGERDRLTAEMVDNRKELLAMMRRGFK